MFGVKYDLIEAQFLAGLVFSYLQLVRGVQNAAIQGKKMFVFFHKASFLGGVVYLIIRIRHCFAGLASGYQF